METRSVSQLRNPASTYSPSVGLVFVFNLIVGTGALTLPSAFSSAGWVLSIFIIMMLAIISYVTLTFVVESMAAANAILRSRRAKTIYKKEAFIHNTVSTEDIDATISASPTKSLLENSGIRRKRPSIGIAAHTSSVIQSDDEDEAAATVSNIEEAPLLSDGAEYVETCDIQETVEMSKLATMFFSKTGTMLFFLCIAIYLYGDLAIYGAAIAKTIRDTTCTHFPANYSCNATLPGNVPCWDSASLTRDDAYRIFLGIFVSTIGQFAFFNVHKTMLLQILTSLVRWSAFIAMISLACIRIANPKEDHGAPNAATVNGLPNLFGACVYSFMCHHSLPSLVTPIKPKQGLYKFLAADYVLITGFYLLLGLTGIYAFPRLEDLYTLNFVPNRCTEDHANNTVDGVLFSVLSTDSGAIMQSILFYFLTLFPVFTLSTSFPIIAITLRNNLKQLFLKREEIEYNFFIRRILFPLLALVPPTVLALVTSDISFLVGITGSYAGAGVQYVVPALLVYYSRKELRKEFSENNGPIQNAFASPFKHVAFVIFTLIWAATSIFFVTYNHFAHSL